MRRDIRQILWDIARAVYRKLPFNSKSKIKLKMLFFKIFISLGKRRLYKKLLLNASGSFRLMDVLEKTEAVDLNEVFSFTEVTHPDVSIIIPVYNSIKYTFACLKSIYKNPPRCSYEIIVMDDCSKDQTREVISKIVGVRLISNPENLGFIRSCNKGAKAAHGKYLFFLNNDTQVLPGWLDELVDTFIAQPEAGLVGSKLIYPDGRLQEAGGIIWNDASAWNYGRFDDPNKPEYNYLREVDYCSGAAIMVPKDIFLAVGCFDERYIPAYCEDSDLAFAIRKAGHKVFYQPLSQIVHFEGISSGTDIGSGVKAYQVTNTVKFFEKWQTVLATHRPNSKDVYLEKDRQSKKRVLFIDSCTPTPDRDAGSVTAFYFMKILACLSFKVTFIPLDSFIYTDKYTSDLQRVGVECLYVPYEGDFISYLKHYGHYYDVVILTRVDYAVACINSVRKYCPQAKVIFNTADLHYLRLQRQAAIEQSKQLAKQAEKVKAIELGMMKKVDCTIVVSEEEKKIILNECPDVNVCLIPLLMDIPGKKLSFAERKNIVFVGNYRHTPNIDAVVYFVKNIWPLIKQKIPELVFYIIGANPPPSIQALAAEDVKLLGFVADLGEYFDRCRLSIAPLRYGAGIKGKIGMSLAYGLPCVATDMAAEGMSLTQSENILIAEDEQSFAEAVVTLYSKQELWEKISNQGLQFVEATYSVTAGKRNIRDLLMSLEVIDHEKPSYTLTSVVLDEVLSS